MTKIGLLAAAATLTAATLATAGSASAQTWYGYNFRATDTTPWAGPYVGIHGGYALDEDNTAYIAGAQANNQTSIAVGNRPNQLIRDKDGYVAGGQVGWNVQAGNIVAGVEGDFSMTDFSSRKGLIAYSGTPTNVLTRNNYLASIRGRVGYVMPGGLLFYGTGGYAATEVKDKARFRDSRGITTYYGSHEYDPDGWVAGAGIEYAIPAAFMNRFGGFLGNSKITTGVEWLHYNFSDKNINVPAVYPGATGAYITRFNNNADIVRARVNYKF